MYSCLIMWYCLLCHYGLRKKGTNCFRHEGVADGCDTAESRFFLIVMPLSLDSKLVCCAVRVILSQYKWYRVYRMLQKHKRERIFPRPADYSTGTVVDGRVPSHAEKLRYGLPRWCKCKQIFSNVPQWHFRLRAVIELGKGAMGRIYAVSQVPSPPSLLCTPSQWEMMARCSRVIKRMQSYWKQLNEPLWSVIKCIPFSKLEVYRLKYYRAGGHWCGIIRTSRARSFSFGCYLTMTNQAPCLG